MTKKHYIRLADYIVSMQPVPLTGFQIERLADFCAEQNPRFNRQYWLGYIAGTNGKNGGVIKRRQAHQKRAN